jgi:nucleoid-associated protein YgaU
LPPPTPKPPKPVPPPTPVPPVENRQYTVVAGDYLRKIAKKFYGDEAKWPKIYEANKKIIGPNPNLILPGQKLVIPD